ncbi:MAG: hypothetical protein EOM26_11585 [Alphaproteobacteria bacterium]|nr:hypothetical protein [Alphaproteobacteria bacterium]
MLKRITLGVLMTGMMSVGIADTQATKRVEDANRFPDNAPVQIYGRVTRITNDALTIDFGEGVVEINLRDIENKIALSQLHQGAMVTVLGHVSTPLRGPKQILADRIAFLTAEKPDTRQFRDSNAAASDAIAGEIVGIFGRNLILDTAGKTVIVSTIPMEIDPTSHSVKPSIEKGDSVRLRVRGNREHRLLVDEVLSIRKSYGETYEPQRLSDTRNQHDEQWQVFNPLAV